jgi:high-affinity nickel-transport protein
MLAFVSIIVLGFFLGMRHATDPDHVIAVTTIVSRQRSIKQAAMIGALWGVGHTLTILLVGSAIILFNLTIPPRVGLTMELSVGVMLILLGILNLSGVLRWLTESFSPANLSSQGQTGHGPSDRDHSGHSETLQGHTGQGHSGHSHFHAHGDYIHNHPHSHAPENHGHAETATPVGWLDRTFSRLGLYQTLRPLAVGIVHGLAGSAAVALLVLTTIRVPSMAVVYLLVFGLGTIAGMMLITAAIAVPFAVSAPRFGRLNRGLSVASGLISFAFGVFIVYQMGFANGLFTSHPNWSPR